ncbi:MAG: serine/threonine-protein kinase, partial [Polyangiaceae bacterium]
MNPLTSGRLISGRYRLEELLGEGGMGVVWRAYDLELGRLVALKFMRGAALFDAGSVTRFRQEAQALARVQVPHVVQVFEYGADLQAPYIVMELLKGEDLGQRLKRLGRLSPVVAVEVVSPVANALQVAHAAGVVHRDLKPGNIFLAQVGGAEVVKLLDFGVAKLVDDTLDADATQTSELMGVPHYMSPEHTHSPKHVDGRTDLWALAVILYRALTGERPFDG